MAKAKLFGFLDQKKETRTGLLDDLDFDQLKLPEAALATLELAEPSPAESGPKSRQVS